MIHCRLHLFRHQFLQSFLYIQKNIGLVAAPSEDIPMLSHSETRHLGITEFETMKALVIRKNQSAEQRTILESITPGMLESSLHSTAKTNS